MHKQIKGLMEYAEILNSHMQYFHKKVLSIQQREIFTSIWHHCAMLPAEHKKHWRTQGNRKLQFHSEIVEWFLWDQRILWDDWSSSASLP